MIDEGSHEFVGRVIDLSVVALSFDTYDELSRYPDCKYAVDVDCELLSLMNRVRSLNMSGMMLWPEHLPENFRDFPLSRYDWLTVAADVFLMRYTSVLDCMFLLTNAVCELGLDAHRCTIKNLEKAGAPNNIVKLLQATLDDQWSLRLERNARFHHGVERGFTDDPKTFEIAATLERRGRGVSGTDEYGRRINVQRSFKEGLIELQREFNQAARLLSRHLDTLYDELAPEFEARFSPRFCAPNSYTNSKANE